MKATNLGSRGSNVDLAYAERLNVVEQLLKRSLSRAAVGFPGYASRRASVSAHGWSVGTWVKFTGGNWVIAKTGSTLVADLIGVVIIVVDTNTVEIALEGTVQIPGTAFTTNTLYYLATADGTATSTVPVAPNVVQPLFFAFQDGWIELVGLAGVSPRSVYLSGLRDVTLTTPATNDLLRFNGTVWVNAAVALGDLANVDTSAAGNGKVLTYNSATLKWEAQTPAAGVTTLAGLSDVTLTSPVDTNFLRYNGSKWVNYDLGPILWVSASRELALDGGGAASAASVVGIGKAASRLLVTAGAGFDFLLSGSVAAGTDKSLRFRSTAASSVSVYDQATTTFASGTKVLEIGCDASAYASRYFRALIPLQVGDNSGGGSKNLILASTAAQTWTLADDVTPFTFMTFYGASADAYGSRIKIAGTIDGGGVSGLTIYGDRSAGISTSRLNVSSTDGFWTQTGNLVFTGATVQLVGTGTTGVYIGTASSDKVGFWGRTPVAKTSVTDPSAITVTGTATGTDATMVNALKTDVTNLRTTLLALCDALQACGLV